MTADKSQDLIQINQQNETIADIPQFLRWFSKANVPEVLILKGFVW